MHSCSKLFVFMISKPNMSRMPIKAALASFNLAAACASLIFAISQQNNSLYMNLMKRLDAVHDLLRQ